ncbi:MAG: bifunctional phosphoribosylaminoimidazolecarboxamide formyltransferase/IMP cyclohydrolase [Pseudomonadota bacterium]
MAVKAISFDVPDIVPIKRALLSVSDKTGLVDFAEALAAKGIELISTGGTGRALKEAGLEVLDISDVTDFPEIMDGRVKTLHPKVHGGLLGIRGASDHREAMTAHNIPEIDLVVVNLYPFEQTVRGGADEATAIENIDIGGPAMLRAAAKNHAYVTVLTDPSDYAKVTETLESGGGIPFSLRRDLAAKAFRLTAHYDAAVSNWFANTLELAMPEKRAFSGTLDAVMRYGENPHQQAGFYKSGEQRFGVATATQVQGKALSFNNINDTNAAFELVSEFNNADRHAVAIIKHANPCGVAMADQQSTAYEDALRTDPVSAFGGIIALNTPLEADAAREIVKTFTEVIIAPEASEEARAIIAEKKNLRLLTTGGLPDPSAPGLDIRSVAGGYLIQDRDNGSIETLDLKVVTERQPDEREWADLKFAFKVAKHVKSNAIVYARDGATVGIGAGQMSRVDSSRIAAHKAEDARVAAGLADSLAQGAVVASDAFFPFADGLLEAVKAGASAVIQPGGSMRDDEVIAAANEAGLAMVFTGMRHFRH